MVLLGLYFKSINNFAKSEFSDENLINDTLDFEITSSNEANLDTPILYNNLANPITISYINQNIKIEIVLLSRLVAYFNPNCIDNH